MNKLRRVRFVLCIAAATVCWAGSSRKVSADLKSASGQTAVIVQYRHETSAGAVEGEVRRRLGQVERTFGRTRTIRAQIHATELENLAAHADVLYVSPDRPVYAHADVMMATIGATAARRYGLDGSGVTVAVVDSGIEKHKDLAGRIIYSESFLADKKGSSGAVDDYGHGTMVAGILAGDGTLSSGTAFFQTFRGVAPGVRIVNLKALDAQGAGSDSSVIAAINRAIELKDTYKIRILNLSLGRTVMESFRTDPLCRAVEAAWRAGILVVVAAGNEGRDNTAGTQGYGTIHSPGNDPLVLTVGAMRTMDTLSRNDDQAATYSSKGPTAIDHIVKPDLVAPGNQVIATAPDRNTTLGKLLAGNFVAESEFVQGGRTDKSKDYFRLSGTSMATPVVSGAAALLLQFNPALTPDQVKARLMKTAFKLKRQTVTAVNPVTQAVYQTSHDIFTVGAGYLDITAALANQDIAAGPAFSPQAVYNTTTQTMRLVSDASVIWGDLTLSGQSAIWGTSVIWGDTVIWGDSVVWGDRAMKPDAVSVIWGDSVIRPNSVVWGDQVLAMGEK